MPWLAPCSSASRWTVRRSRGSSGRGRTRKPPRRLEPRGDVPPRARARPLVVMPATAGLAGIPVGGDHPVAVGGVLNVSPESFYPGSVHRLADDLRRAALGMVEAGAALVDVGARST